MQRSQCISFPKFQHNRNLTITAATETSFPPLFVIPTRTENQNQKPKIPSFPQKRESSPFSFGHFR
ncbi:hypothetical protein CWI44_08030 [Neisseria meningitidis]|nr:hypothetical protein CWI44_08030 [Neisseria meningitidis]